MARPRTIVCLVDDSEIGRSPFVDELAYCQANQIEVVRIPILLGGWPEGDQIQQFLSIATDPARQPVLVHCAQGVRRTGMMAAAYQESVLGYDKSRAKESMLTFGHSRRTVGDIERFIDNYDPAARQMTAMLPRSAE
jgi:protein tyrosine/serine phosphatase